MKLPPKLTALSNPLFQPFSPQIPPQKPIPTTTIAHAGGVFPKILQTKIKHKRSKKIH